jgi:hypothetical protein
VRFVCWCVSPTCYLRKNGTAYCYPRDAGSRTCLANVFPKSDMMLWNKGEKTPLSSWDSPFLHDLLRLCYSACLCIHAAHSLKVCGDSADLWLAAALMQQSALRESMQSHTHIHTQQGKQVLKTCDPGHQNTPNKSLKSTDHPSCQNCFYLRSANQKCMSAPCRRNKEYTHSF